MLFKKYLNMTALLYYSISSDLTEARRIEINKRVTKNRQVAYLFVRKLPSNLKGRAKRLFVHGMCLFQLSQPLVPCLGAVMLPLQPAIHRLSFIEHDMIQSNKNSYPQIASILESKIDKMVITDQQIEDLNLICYKLQTGSVTLDTAILKLRAGGFYDLATLAFIIYMLSLHQGNSFQSVPTPHMDPVGWLSGKYNSRNVGAVSSQPTTRLGMEKPASMPQQQYSDMTKSERRQLPDPRGRDGIIKIDRYPQLDLRFNQVKYKTPKHGPDHGLPKDSNGKTPKTDANIIALLDSLLDMPNRQDIVWYTDGQYQGETPLSCDSVNLFDPATNLIAVYQKQPDGSNFFLL